MQCSRCPSCCADNYTLCITCLFKAMVEEKLTELQMAEKYSQPGKVMDNAREFWEARERSRTPPRHQPGFWETVASALPLFPVTDNPRVYGQFLPR
jgi:hypothetical protein